MKYKRIPGKVMIVAFLTLGCQKEIVNEAMISGTVRDDGGIASDATVNLYSRLENSSTISDVNGAYRFKHLPRGDYKITGFKSTATGTVLTQINTDGEQLIANITLSIPPPPSTGGGGSCPYIYTFNGESYVFNGDIYAGAIYPNLERNDYTSLHDLNPVNGEYRIKIANELQERQYTNIAELLVVKHPNNVHVLFDKYGNLQTFSKPLPPLSALSPLGVDYKPFLQKSDEHSYLFNEEPLKAPSLINKLTDLMFPQSGMNSLIVTFNKPKDAQHANLVVKAKNSNWSVLLWHQFTELFGDYFNTWRKEQSLRPTDELLAWREREGIPMMVYLETNTGWEYLDCFNMVGSVVSREMIMSLNLSKYKGAKLKLKFECAFMFWELDYAAMDYSEQVSCQVERISPSELLGKNNENAAGSLKIDDSLYLSHLNNGDQNVLIYPASPLTIGSGTTSYILHSKGYYEQKVNSTRTPDYLTLLTFLRPGAFAQYSLNHFSELSHGSALASGQDR